MVLEPVERRQRVAELRKQGLSFRTIGQQLGVSYETIRRDARAGLSSVTPLPAQPRSRGEAFRAHVLEVFELDEADHQVLEQITRLLDRLGALRAAIEADGVMITTKRGELAEHPALAAERSTSLAAARLLGVLSLPNEDGEALPTPAQVQARKAARTRWANHNRRWNRDPA
jgi:transposase